MRHQIACAPVHRLEGCGGFMRCLIVNGDDFGASRGINLGIMEAHRSGVLTSASLLVNTPWSHEAAALSRNAPEMSVGLHVDIEAGESGPPTSALRAILGKQLSSFQRLMGRLPTHLDSHRNIHRDPRLLPSFVALGLEFGMPLRGHSSIHHLSKFYGQWGGETHPEQIDTVSLARMLATEIGEGITELMCHPGYIDAGYRTSYSVEREIELRTLCDPIVRRSLVRESIQLISFHNVARILACTSPRGKS
jgi:chitin disaccharide deacetylase